MRERQIRKLMDAQHLAIVHVPKCVRREMEMLGVLVTEYIDGYIIAITVESDRRQCVVTIRDGMGRDVKVKASSVIRYKTQSDSNGSNFSHKLKKNPKVKKQRKEQMRLFQ